MVANLRIIYDNAINKASVTASSTAGSLVASNLLSDLKSQIWRSTDTAPTLTFTWTQAQVVAGFSLVFTNLTSSATIRARGYAETIDVVPLFDTGAVLAVPSALGGFNWGMVPLGVNSYAYGGGSTATLWMTATAIKKLVIDISDPTNTAGFVEASRAVAGAYFSPVYNAQYGGVKVGAEDTSKHDRSAAGDLLTDRGVMYKTLDIDLQLMPHVDRNTVWQILRGNGMSHPVFVSVLPNSTDDVAGEQIYTIYGKLSRTSALTYAAYNQHSAPLQIEEI